MRLAPLLACTLVIACGPGPSLTTGDSTGSTTAATDSAATDTATPTGDVPPSDWTEQPDECGGLYGLVILADGDVVAVGGLLEPIQQISLPWAVRYTADGELVWSEVFTEQAPIGVLAAAVLVDDDIIAVGTRDSATPLLLRLTTAGDVVWSTSGVPADGSLLAAAWSPTAATLWTTGTAASTLLVARHDAAGALVDTLPVPGGSPTVGFAIAALPDGAVVCGRAAAGEGGRLWLARYAVDGTTAWTAVGPDPGVGAFSDCWDVAAWPDGSTISVEAGFLGSRVARVDPLGALAWEYEQPNAGAQAVDIVDDLVVVAGWSASDESRSHATGDRHGWLRRFDRTTGGPPEHTWLGVAHVSPRDVKVHPAGGAIIVGQRISESACEAPWIGRYAY